MRGLGPGRFKGTDGRIDFINQTGDMKLDLNAEMLVELGEADQLMTLGYDRQISSRYSSMAVSGAGSDEISVERSSLVLNSLAGLIPGLNVMRSGNIPGNAPVIYVRGRGSFQGNSVLFIVDGIERNPSFISSEEVESVTVLKDAASIAIYGNRGADGVVIRGRNTEVVVSVDPERMVTASFCVDYHHAVSSPVAIYGN